MNISIDAEKVSNSIQYPFWLKNAINKIVIDSFLTWKNTYIISNAKNYTVKHWVALNQKQNKNAHYYQFYLTWANTSQCH